jgi:putative acetyltransferase
MEIARETSVMPRSSPPLFLSVRTASPASTDAPQILKRMIEIREAKFPEDHDVVKDIFLEYVLSPSVSLVYQDYEVEFSSLPGNYAPPQGRLLLAWQGSVVVGCAALRQVDQTICEMKRVYVRPVARGTKLGRRLVERILLEARIAGYTRVCLDVLPEFTTACQIYLSLGFKDAPPVSFNPVPGTRFLGLDLLSHNAAWLER